jgi:hypothetical protein
MREYRGRQRDKRLNQFAGELARARSTSAVNVLASAMLRPFGSPDRLGEALFGAIETARKHKRTVGRALRSMFAVMRVLETCDAAKPPGPDYAPPVSPEVQDPDLLDLNTLNAKEIEQLISEYYARRGPPQAPA